MLGERPGGWFAYPVMLATLRQAPHQWFRLDVLEPRKVNRLRRELAEQEHYPNTYEVDVEMASGMVLVRCVPKRDRAESPGVRDTEIRGWESSPGRHFDPGRRPGVDYNEGDEHDPDLGPNYGEE